MTCDAADQLGPVSSDEVIAIADERAEIYRAAYHCLLKLITDPDHALDHPADIEKIAREIRQDTIDMLYGNECRRPSVRTVLLYDAATCQDALDLYSNTVGTLRELVMQYSAESLDPAAAMVLLRGRLKEHSVQLSNVAERGRQRALDRGHEQPDV